MKVGVIGNGHVGLDVFRELLQVRYVSEVVLIGRNEEKVLGEIEDCRDAAALRPFPTPRISGGGYSMAEGCDILIYTVGVKNRTQDRMEILKENAAITSEVFKEIGRYNKDAIIICVTNPLDVVTTVVQKVTGKDRGKVIGTGTLLDSARLSRYMAELLEISPKSVSIYVVGEHGNSSVSLLSSCRIDGKTLQEYFLDDVGGGDLSEESVYKMVRQAGYKIHQRIGYTSAGVASAAARIVTAIAGNERELLPVSVVLAGEYQMEGFAISTPCIIGREGIMDVKEIKMTPEEMALFKKSASVISEAVKSLI